MIFADLTAGATDSWITLLLQGGALAILAYHFLLGLPKMLQDAMGAHERIVDKLNTEFNRRNDKVSDAVKDQTVVLSRKLEEIRQEAHSIKDEG